MNFTPMVINVVAYKVNSMDRASEVNMGPVQKADIFLATKRNQGFGEDNGDFSFIPVPVNLIGDQDLFDNPSAKGSVV